jgi:hypothetical protein
MSERKEDVAWLKGYLEQHGYEFNPAYVPKTYPDCREMLHMYNDNMWAAEDAAKEEARAKKEAAVGAAPAPRENPWAKKEWVETS